MCEDVDELSKVLMEIQHEYPEGNQKVAFDLSIAKLKSYVKRMRG
jgi:hypothetical protein